MESFTGAQGKYRKLLAVSLGVSLTLGGTGIALYKDQETTKVGSEVGEKKFTTGTQLLKLSRVITAMIGSPWFFYSKSFPLGGLLTLPANLSSKRSQTSIF